MKLFNYWRSSASYRVRIALHFKGLSFDYAPVNLLKGEQHEPAHISRNPWHSVPVLELDDGTQLTQSVAIAEYLEEAFPTPPLFPKQPLLRARMRAMVEVVNSGMQPLQNLQVLAYVRETLKGDAKPWAEKWLGNGLDALEAMAAQTAGRFLIGDTFTLADACLVPQLFGTRRLMTIDEARYPTLLRVEQLALEQPFVRAARPEAQPDAVA